MPMARTHGCDEFKIWERRFISTQDDQDFDLDKVRKNKNSEWQDFEFQEGEDWYEFEYQVISSDDSHEEILESEDDFDEGFEALCAELKEGGYTFQKEELVIEKEPLAELTKINLCSFIREYDHLIDY